MIDIKNAYGQAKKFKSCEKFTGNEDDSNITDLMFSPQGIEFCTKNNTPTLDIFVEHKSRTSKLEKKGLFINAGEVDLHNVPNIWLVGDTKAKITINDKDVSHQIILMHGATAEIYADNFAVVFVYGEGVLKKETKNHALIL